MSKGGTAGTRSRARELAVQALYQEQISAHEIDELLRQFRERPDYQRVDQAYFEENLRKVCENRADLEKTIAAFVDRPQEQLDPVERAILLQGVHELEARPDIPFRVVINEAVNLAKMFGALDGHKYINAVLDRAAAKIRPADRP